MSSKHIITLRTLRHATRDDLPEVERILREAARRGTPTEVGPDPTGEQHVLVLDGPLDTGLAAVAVVTLQGTHSRIAMLAIDVRYSATGLEERLRSALAMVRREPVELAQAS